MAWIWPGLTLRVPMVGKDFDGCSGETAHLAKTAKLHCNGRLRPTTAAQLADGAVVALFVSIGGQMTNYGFVGFLALLKAGHAAHPQC